MSGRIIHIRGLRATLLAALLPMVVGGCAHAPVRSEAGAGCEGSFEEAAVVAVLERQREAWNEGDLEGFLAGYERSPELLFTSGAKIRRGFEETRDKYRARYGDARETMGRLSFEILEVRGLGRCADAAVVLGRWGLSETPEAGGGVFSVILEREGEHWVIVHDHTSAEP